tara:strand:- start:3320 stop:3589 length:270 start_codon:yes stop_codon:yes gene_type:complete
MRLQHLNSITNHRPHYHKAQCTVTISEQTVVPARGGEGTVLSVAGGQILVRGPVFRPSSVIHCHKSTQRLQKIWSVAPERLQFLISNLV